MASNEEEQKAATRSEVTAAGEFLQLKTNVSSIETNLKKNSTDTTRKLNAQDKKLDEQAQKLDSQDKKLDDQAQKLDAQDKKLDDLLQLLKALSPSPAPTGGPPPPGGTPHNTQTQVQAPQLTTSTPTHSSRRPPDASSVEKLGHDITRAKLARWRRVWRAFEEHQQLISFPKPQQIGTLLTRLSLDLQRILEINCEINFEATNLTPTDVLAALDAYLKTCEHPAKPKLAFVARVQQEGESVNDFHIALQDLGDRADLCSSCRDMTLSIQFLAGLRSDDVRQSVLALETFPDLKGLVKKCVCEEASRRDKSVIKHKNGQGGSINRFNAKKKGQFQGKDKEEKKGKGQDVKS